MIPKRIVTQYTQHCSEKNYKPFSRSTLLRILSECSASVRKSLQGLDYFLFEFKIYVSVKITFIVNYKMLPV